MISEHLLRLVAAPLLSLLLCGQNAYVIAQPTSPPTSSIQGADGQIVKQSPQEEGASKGVSGDCQPVYKRALQLLQEYDAKLPPAERKVAETVVDRAVKNGSSRADGYNEYGGGAMMQAQFAAAAWGGLKAATLEWNPHHVSNVGIYLSYLNRLDDAGTFLQCASKMAPQSPFVIEGRAMLAYRQRDYKSAAQLIEQAARMMPRDLNIRYSAGVIFYKAGDRARAKQYLQEAQRMAPNYQTIIDALKVVDPSGQSTPPPQDALQKLIAECFRFMDEMLARGEAAARYREELNVVRRTLGGGVGSGGGQESVGDVAGLRRDVEQRKKEITRLEVRARDNRNSARSVDWNATLAECIQAYLQTAADYQEIINQQSVDIVIALSMRMTPLRLVEKMSRELRSSNPYWYVVQDEHFKYRKIEDPAREAYEAGEKSCKGLPDDNACIKRYEEAYCATVIPPWNTYRNNVLENMRAAESGFLDAAENYASRWNRLSNQAADYSKRSLSAMKRITDTDLKHIPAAARQQIIAAASPEAHARLTKQSYSAYIGSRTSMVEATLSQSHEFVIDALDTAPGFVHRAFYIDSCQQSQPDAVKLDAELEKLLAAFKEATSYENSFYPECELEIGGFKKSFKPFGSKDKPFYLNDINLEDTLDSNVKISVDAEDKRWGVEYSPEIASLDAQWGPTTGEVSVKVWGEGGTDGLTDYGVQGEAKFGLGVKKEGIGGFACYFITASVKFNARAFADALRQ